MKYYIIIPARLASTRLPEKPLIEIVGKSLIRRTYEQCLKACEADKIIVATDHERIYNHCKDYNINVMMTSNNCLTGTDRVAEIADKLDADFFINVQGDEPLINPLDIIKMINVVEEGKYEIVAGYTGILNKEDFMNYSIPKVVLSEDKNLLYMSRSPIPGNKKKVFQKSWRQVCIYAFSKSSLKKFTSRTEKTELEQIEDLELLRFLEMGINIKMIELSNDSIAVDCLEDVKKVEKIILKIESDKNG
jgi:3-deoxy-manno-octulosonate cytidylyltransferase (CMP-KDO synthetase)